MEVQKSLDNLKILITHVYSSHNKGDAALLGVLVDDIRKEFINPEITVLTLDEFIYDDSNIKIEKSLMGIARDAYSFSVLKLFYSLFLVLYSLFWVIVYRLFKIRLKLNKKIDHILNIYVESDLIIPVGGGYIRGNKGINGTTVTFFIVFPIILSYYLNKITIGYSQSIGPFGNKFQEFLAKVSIKRMSGLILREKISMELLKKWGINNNIYLSVDSGFLFNINEKHENFSIFNNDKKIVGVTVRTWLNKQKQEKYEKDIASLCDYIIEKYDYNILFIPQVTVENHNDDDRISSRRVYSYIKNKNKVKLIEDKISYKMIKSLYSNLDYLIGTRFHSVIFALTSMVPSIAIQYEHKTRGIMRDLDLEKWVVDIDKTDHLELNSMFDSLVFQRSLYVDSLKNNLNRYVDRAKETIKILKSIYKNK